MRIILSILALLCVCASVRSQNVFNPLDTQARYNETAPLGSRNRPNPAVAGLQKWVSVATNGISNSYDASSYKAYYINVASRRMPFRLKFPKSYSNPDSVNKRYPMMLFFHGAGEPGCPTNGGVYNNEKQLTHGGKLFMDRVDNNEFDGFLFYPQAIVTGECSNYWGTGWDVAILAVLDSMAKYIRFDADRLFVNGLSDGGRTTWRFARTYPQRVARVAPSAMSAMTTDLTSMIHIPVWFASGGRDTNPSPEQSQETLTTFTNLGGNIKYTLFPTLGHGVWNQHWNEPGYVDYMNKTHKANPLVYFNRYEWCPGQPISAKLGLTPGFAEYEWERDGVVIARRINGTNTILSATHVASFTGNEVTVKSYGTYRARFKRTTSSAWSVWSPNPAVLTTKGITQTGPISIAGTSSNVLPAPDGSTTVPLQLDSGFLNYQWYRVSDNVLVNSTRIFNAPVGEYRARYSEQYGCGTNFSPNFTVISANGTPKPDAAANLIAVPVSERIIQLTWENNTSPTVNETGFEIYRGTTPGGPYTLLTINPADSLSYRDRNLTPNTNYYYLVRAVGATGAAANSNEAGSKTIKDMQAPTAPERLEYRGSNQYSVALRWNSSSDNVGVRRYDIYVNGVKFNSTTSTSFTVRGLDSLKYYAFTVKAVDEAGNTSAPSAQLVAYTHRQGLTFKYIQGTYSALPNFTTATAVKTGITDSVNTGTKIRNQADNYGILWTGYIYVPATATYTFETNSDEGSKVFIDAPYSFNGTPVVNNDGLHTARIATGTIDLTEGYHQIAVAYFERSGTETMELYWSNNAGFTRRRVVDLYFSHVNVASTPLLAAPANLTATGTGYNKVKLNWSDLSNNETGFEIVRSLDSNFSSIATVAVNTTTFTDSALASATTYFYKVRTIGATNESPYTDVVSATTDAAPGAPVAPTNLAADNIATTLIGLSWRDNGNNETGIQVWRSIDNINYSLLTTLAPNSNTYTDKDVTAFAQYYYFVRGVNEEGNGLSSDTLPVIAGNNAPVISALTNMFIKTDATANQNFTVTDAGDVVTLSIANKPGFVNIQSLGGTSYRIVVAPTINNIGWYDLVLTATDSKGAVTNVPFRISVADKNVRSVYINLGSDVAPAPWNNWPGVRGAGNVLGSLRDETNTVTPFSITTVNNWALLNQMGHMSGNNSGAVPDSTLRSGVADNNATARQIRFSGLNRNLRYNLVFVGSQNEGLNAITEYSTGLQRDTLNARYNYSLTANLNTLTPDINGQILVNARVLNGYSYLNAVIIEEYNPSITLLNPVNLAVEAVDRTIINVTWSDRTNNEAALNGYELTRAGDSLFTSIQAVINLPANATSYRNTGLTANTKYWYRVRARNGSSFSTYSNLAKTITPANRVALNFNVTVPNAAAPWNNTESAPDAGESFSNLVNHNNINSGLAVRIEAGFNGEFTAGMSTGNNSGVVPDNVLKSDYWIDRGQLAQLRVTGLNHTKRYRFGFIGSTSPNGWYKDNYTCTYTINGRTVYLNSWTNTTKVAYIGDVVPGEAGDVYLNISTTQAAAYGFTGGIIIDDYTDVQGGSALNSVLEDTLAIEQYVAADNAIDANIYPNPFRDEIRIDFFNSSAANKISTEIFDISGRKIYQKNFDGLSAGNNTVKMDVGNRAKHTGIYMVMLRINDEAVKTMKLVRTRK